MSEEKIDKLGDFTIITPSTINFNKTLLATT